MTQKGIRETITFSCEPEFKKLIATKVEEFGYQNTSQMIRDALQKFFESEDALANISETTVITAIISVVYDHHDLGTIRQFIDVQHRFNIGFSSHFHMTSEECLENLVISDIVKNIRILLKKLRSVDGLKYISMKTVSRAQMC